MDGPSLVALVGLAVLLALGASLAPFWLREAAGLTRGERRVFRAYGEALLAGDDGAARPPLHDILDGLGRTLDCTSPTARLVIRLALWAFEWLPLTLWLGPRWFSLSTLEQRRAVLGRGARARGPVLGGIFQIVTFPIASAVSGSVEGKALAGVDREGRIAECRAAREAVVRRSTGGHR